MLSGTPRSAASFDGQGEMMSLDTPVGQTSVRCPAHRENAGTYVGYSTYAVPGPKAQARAQVCPLAPPPIDNRWVYTQRTRSDQSTVELWASITSDPETTPRWQRAAPTLSLTCALGTDDQAISVRLDWIIPPHTFEGDWEGEYSLAWETPPNPQHTRWAASPIEAEAVWMLEPSPGTIISTLMGAPASTSAQDATITFSVTDDTGTQHRAAFDLVGWEHAVPFLAEDCSPPES